MKEDRFVRIWKVGQFARSIVSKTRSTNASGPSLWNRSDMVFTKIMRGSRHAGACSGRAWRRVRSNPVSQWWSDTPRNRSDSRSA